MSLSIDSKTVLRAFAEHPDVFPAVQVDLAEFAKKMLVKQLKAKSTNAELFKKVYHSVGEGSIATIIDGFSASDLVALLKKIDPHSPLVKSGSDAGQTRAHIIDIAMDRASPYPRAEKKPKTPLPPKSTTKATQPKIGGILESKVHSGRASTGRAKKAK